MTLWLRRLVPALLLLSACAAPPLQEAGDSAVLSASPGASAARPAASGTTARRAPRDPHDVAAFATLSEPARRAYLSADLVVVAHLEEPRIQSILEVAPPIYVHAFDVVVDERLGGGALPERVPAIWSTRDRAEPWVAGKAMLVALQRVEANLQGETTRYDVTWIEPSSSTLAAAVATARSPADPALTWSARQLLGANVVKWSNEYGDGEFELTLRNDGDAPVTVPGLFMAGGTVLWAQALVVRDEHGRELPLSRAPLPAGATPVVLAPGAAIVTTVDVKPLGGLHLPGGGRLTYSFGLGELRTSSFFYFTDTLHGPLMGKP